MDTLIIASVNFVQNKHILKDHHVSAVMQTDQDWIKRTRITDSE